MIGDNDIDILEAKAEKRAGDLKKEFLDLFKDLEKERCICQEVYEKYGKIIKIRKIYVKPKGSRNNYYTMTFEKDEKNNDDYGVW